MRARVRSLDQFGTPISLHHEEQTKFKTFGGGLCSMCLKSVLLGFLCLKILAVVNFEDPNISSYSIQEDRSTMESAINLADYSSLFYFGFMDKKYQTVTLEPRIGNFSLTQNSADFSDMSKY